MNCSKRFQSLTGQENFGSLSSSGTVSNGNTGAPTQSQSSGGGQVTMADLESLRQEILSDMRAELQKIKQEIIDGWCFNL